MSIYPFIHTMDLSHFLSSRFVPCLGNTKADKTYCPLFWLILELEIIPQTLRKIQFTQYNCILKIGQERTADV